MNASSLFSGFEAGSIIVSEGIEIAYVIGGSGPPVLLLHGYPQTKALWAQVAPILAEHFTVVAADLRGYGASSKPDNNADNSAYSFRAFANDQVELMRHLGLSSFHAVGHDRGGRTVHRMALDHPAVVKTLTVMDIIPTSDVFAQTDKLLAMTYWHWFFLAQPSPFPETLINADPDLFFETCLLGWGKSTLEDFDADQLADYRASWHDPAMVHGSCSDYRAGATVDSDHDAADSNVKVSCPTLVMYGADGVMADMFDIPALWHAKCRTIQSVGVPGGHFFIDQSPQQTADSLLAFLGDQPV
ncbi:MAG: alpha/beta fold hydrolase [Hyphomicrobiales bacterium]